MYALCIEGFKGHNLNTTDLYTESSSWEKHSGYVFDSWSQKEKEEFFCTYQDSLSSVLTLHYDNYDNVQNNDIVFEIVCACKFIPEQPVPLLSFYAHVLTRAIKNTTDGYVGEMCMEQCYKLFVNYPLCFYQYWNYVDKNTKDLLMDYVCQAFQMEDMDAKTIDEIFENNKKQYPEYDKSIQFIKGIIRLRMQ